MKYNVILEGCDCVGKTSVADLFRRLQRAEVVHMGPPESKESAKAAYEELVIKLNARTSLVMDRGPLGECVYGPIKRGYYPEYMRDLEKQVKPHTFLVLLSASEETVKKRFDGKHITEAEIPVVLESFWKEFNASNYARKFFVYTDNHYPLETYMEIVRLINQAIKNESVQ